LKKALDEAKKAGVKTAVDAAQKEYDDKKCVLVFRARSSAPNIDVTSKTTQNGLAALSMPKLSQDEIDYFNNKALYDARNDKPAMGEEPVTTKQLTSGDKNQNFITPFNKDKKDAKISKWTSGGIIWALDPKSGLITTQGIKWQEVTRPFALGAGPSGTTDELLQHADWTGIGRTGLGSCQMRDGAMSNMILYNHHTFAEVMQGAAGAQRPNLKDWVPGDGKTIPDYIAAWYDCDQYNDNKAGNVPINFQWTGTAAPTFDAGKNTEAKFWTPLSRETTSKAVFAELNQNKELRTALNTQSDFGVTQNTGAEVAAPAAKTAFCGALTSANYKMVVGC